MQSWFQLHLHILWYALRLHALFIDFFPVLVQILHLDSLHRCTNLFMFRLCGTQVLADVNTEQKHSQTSIKFHHCLQKGLTMLWTLQYIQDQLCAYVLWSENLSRQLPKWVESPPANENEAFSVSACCQTLPRAHFRCPNWLEGNIVSGKCMKVCLRAQCVQICRFTTVNFRERNAWKCLRL